MIKSKNVYWIGIIAILLVSLHSFFSGGVEESELTYYSGTFKKINYHKSRGNSVSYSLFLNEFEDHFKISADYVTCFEYAIFERRVDIGDSLKVGITSRDGLIRKGSVASIKSKRQSFFDLKCRNKSSISNTVLLFIICSILIIVYFLSKRNRLNE